jgi:ribosomal protein S18 acetylase RimI-like enzyme
MLEKLRDLSRQPVIEAMVANNTDFIGLFKNAPDVQASFESDAAWFVTGIPFPLFNGVIRTNLSSERADLVISEILGIFQERNLPMIWSVTPLSRPHDLGERLEAHGLQLGGDSPSMSVDLTSVSGGVDEIEGLTIQLVQNGAELSSWCDVLIGIFGFPAFVSQALFNFLDIPGYSQDAPIKNFMGFENGKLVAVSSLLLAGGVAGIYNVGTLPEARHRGFGRAITLAPILEARDLGYRVGVLQSSDMGFGLYSKIGFKEYCKFSRYLWLPQ